MTAKEELKELLLSLTPEQIEQAVKVFQACSLELQGKQQPRSPKD